MGAWGRGSAIVLCAGASASASVQLIINKYVCGLCVVCQLISSTNGHKICNKSLFFRLGLKLYDLYIFVQQNLLTFFFFFFGSSNSVIFQVGKYQTTIVII